MESSISEAKLIEEAIQEEGNKVLEIIRSFHPEMDFLEARRKDAGIPYLLRILR